MVLIVMVLIVIVVVVVVVVIVLVSLCRSTIIVVLILIPIEWNTNGCSHLIESLVVQEVVDVPKAENWHDKYGKTWNRQPEVTKRNDDERLDNPSSNWEKQELTKIKSIGILKKHDESGVQNNCEVVRFK